MAKRKAKDLSVVEVVEIVTEEIIAVSESEVTNEINAVESQNMDMDENIIAPVTENEIEQEPVVENSVVENEINVAEEMVEPVKKSRRQNGSGSIWRNNSSNTNYGLCVILQGGKGKQLIRHIEYRKTEKEILERMAWVQEHKAELLQARLDKLKTNDVVTVEKSTEE